MLYFEECKNIDDQYYRGFIAGGHCIDKFDGHIETDCTRAELERSKNG
jgi:hypothetical protein